ncbi:MAG: hypothetical protein IJ785_00370 [Bacteroidales bacterium]|nr:hypothetical protein [Bacteroidales bacterium]
MKTKKNAFVAMFALTFLSVPAFAQTFNTLGIGIASPQGTLHVHTSQGYNYDEPIREGLNPYDYYRTLFRITNTVTGTGSTDGFVVDQIDNEVTLRQYENAPLHFKTYNGLGFTLLPSGLLGVGTTQPTATLHVDGDAKVTSNLTTGSYASFCTNGQPLTIGMAHTQQLGFGSAYIGFNAQKNGTTWSRRNNTWLNGGAVIWATMGGDLLFATLPSTGGSSVTDMTDQDVMSAVNMRLGADGILYAKEIKVTLTGWPDYVFGQDFHLLPLDETESYIKENGHLPGVPSATEVEEDGLSVGEMNKVLMQKVEELTLYVIELQKQINDLKNHTNHE